MRWGFQRHPNTAAANRKFFGFEGRSDQVQLIVIHTAELSPDLVGQDSAAEALSKFMGNPKESRVSWHTSVDADSVLHELPAEYTGSHVRHWNSRTVGIEIATKADLWGELPDRHRTALVENTAKATAWFCRSLHIPVARVHTLDEARAGVRGIVAHATLDPTRRTDPGPEFPWSQLLAQVQALLACLSSTNSSEPLRTTTAVESP